MSKVVKSIDHTIPFASVYVPLREVEKTLKELEREHPQYPGRPTSVKFAKTKVTLEDKIADLYQEIQELRAYVAEAEGRLANRPERAYYEDLAKRLIKDNK